jgi:hypothetical protein
MLETVKPGATVEVAGHAVGQAPRVGEVVAVLGAPPRLHLRVRWDGGRETTLFPGSDVRVLEPD